MKITRAFQRRGLIAVALLALFSVTGFLVLPPIIKAQLQRRLSSELGRAVSVGKVRLNPYVLSLTIEDFAIKERDGATAFLGWQRLHVNFDALSSLRGEWVLSEVALAGFDARVRVNADQSLNFSDLLAKFAPASAAPATPAPAKPARPVRVARLHVSSARVELADLSQSRPFATTLGPLTFELTGFRTISEHGAPYRFAATTEAGEKLAWSGTLRAEPFRSAGELSLERIALPKYAPYYASRMQAELASGQLSVRGRYEIDLTGGKRVLQISDAAVQVRGFALRERGSENVALEFAAFDLTGLHLDALTQKVSVGTIAVADGHLRARREKDGSINLLTILQPPAAAPAASIGSAAPAAAPAAPAAPPPDVTAGEIALQRFQVEFVDLAAPSPARLALHDIQFSLKDVTLALGARMPLQLAFGWAPQGTVRLDGSVGLTPLEADLKVAVTSLALLPLSPYLEQFANVRLTEGTTSLTLDTRVALPAGQPAAATVTGDVNVEKLSFVDGARNEELAGFAELNLRGLQAATTPATSVALDEVNLVGPYVRVIVNADKSLNLSALAKPTASPAAGAESPAPAAATPPATATAAPAAAAAAPATATTLPSINVARISIADGDFRFTDRSIEPGVSLAINRFGGTVIGLSSTNPARADVDLKAAVDGAGPVSITGKLDPLGANPSVDLKVDFKNVDLLPLSAYSGKYAGFELARGKLALDVAVRVDGKKVDSATVITLDHFTFGAPVQSAAATGLPVRLGVALLKDLNGRIVIDVPVQGSTDDPSFRVGRVVLRVVGNLLTKAAVSPFSLIGAAFGGGGDELAFQEFAPGSAEIQPAGLKKLQTMVQALTNRPGLSLGLEGSYDDAADTYALKRVKLAEQVRRRIWEAKHLADPNIPPPAQLVITPEENAAALKQLFDARFPPGTQFGTPLPPPPVVVSPPPPPASFFKRMVRAVTFQGKREERAAQQENERRAAEHTQAVAVAIASAPPVEEMAGRLAEATTVDDNDLRSLAQARAQQVREYLATAGGIAPDRLFLAQAAAAAPGSAASGGKGPRVFLQLQ